MAALRRVAFVLDPLDTLHPGKDSSISLMRAAQARGASIFVTRCEEMWCDAATGLAAHGHFVELREDPDWCRMVSEETRPFLEFDFVLMRKDPPIDLRYLSCVWMLSTLQRQGGRVLNAPQALLEMNEKLSVLEFPDLAPPMRVSMDPARLQEFLWEYNEIVVKPLDRMGGAGVRRISREDPSAKDVLEESTGQGTIPMVAQQFLPDVFQGDRRLLLVDGELAPYAMIRIPKEGEFRANLAQGGRSEVEQVDDRDREIAARLKEPLRKAGVHLAGIDVVGGFLTEINLTSPTGLREIENHTGWSAADCFWDTACARWLEE